MQHPVTGLALLKLPRNGCGRLLCNGAVDVIELDGLVTADEHAQDAGGHVIDHLGHVAGDDLTAAILLVAVGFAVVELDRRCALIVQLVVLGLTLFLAQERQQAVQIWLGIKR
ncbi:MAG TPA: hypothetical protein VFI87_06385 [Hyphomicrobiaceae bacterium]|nr:hypothetical protein [Hyphomicrobiaceae bacterium]